MVGAGKGPVTTKGAICVWLVSKRHGRKKLPFMEGKKKNTCKETHHSRKTPVRRGRTKGAGPKGTDE